MFLDEDWDIELNHDEEMVWQGVDVYISTGRIPSIYEISGDGRPSTWVSDIIMTARSIRYQYNHAKVARDANK